MAPVIKSTPKNEIDSTLKLFQTCMSFSFVEHNVILKNVGNQIIMWKSMGAVHKIL